MNRTSKMVTLFQEKIRLRKKVDYQEECLLRMIKYKLFIKKIQKKDYLKSSVDTYRKIFLWIEDRTLFKAK